MVPKSYVDLKRYLVDDSNLAGGDMETVKIVQKPILPSPKPKEMVILPTNTPDESLTSSDVISSNSVNSSLTNLENPIQVHIPTLHNRNMSLKNRIHFT